MSKTTEPPAEPPAEKAAAMRQAIGDLSWRARAEALAAALDAQNNSSSRK